MSITVIAKVSQQNGEEEKCWLQVVAVLIACIASITDGMLMSWSSPFILKITQDKVHYDITEEEASLFAVLPSIAMMTTCFLFGIVCDRIGRKRTLMLVAVPQLGSWLLKLFARDVWVFYVARILAGIGTGGIFAALPMYIGETSSPKVRGLTGSFPSSINFFGQFLIIVIGNFFDLPTVSYICLPLPVVFLVAFYFMPESPTYYLAKGDEEAARASLRALTRKRDVEDELALLRVGVERQLSERATWRDLFAIDSNRRAVTAGALLRISQGLSGLPLFSTAMQFVFANSEGFMSPALATMITTFTCFSSYVIAGNFADRLGRRTAYMCSMSSCSLVLLALGAYFAVERYAPSVDLGSLAWLPFAAIELCIAFGSFGPGIVPTMMIGELFSASVKAKATTLMATVFGLFMFVCVQLFFQLYAVTGLCGPFLLYGVCSLASVGATYLLLPETKGKTLEEIQQMLKKGKFR